MVDSQHRAISPTYLGALVFTAAIFIRLAVSLHPYSGKLVSDFMLISSWHTDSACPSTIYYSVLVLGLVPYYIVHGRLHKVHQVESTEMPWFCVHVL